MAIQKVYRAVQKGKGKDGKDLVTWHENFKTVEREGPGRQSSKVGKGKEIPCEKTPVHMGEGVYYRREALTDAEFEAIKAHTATRIGQPRLNKALDALDGMINAAKSNATTFNEEQARVIMASIMGKCQELESQLTKNWSAPARKKGAPKNAVTF